MNESSTTVHGVTEDMGVYLKADVDALRAAAYAGADEIDRLEREKLALEVRIARVRASLETAIRLHANDDNPAVRVIARDALHAMDEETK